MRKARVAVALAFSVALGCAGTGPDPAIESAGGGGVEAIQQDVTESATLLINESFGSTTGGFTYADDRFRGTAQPSYASGTRVTSGGISGGTLRVDLGGKDNADIRGMSGGWSKTFSLTAPARVTVSFQYRLTQTANYESDEVSQALVSVDGVLKGSAPNDFVAQVAGNGDGGSAITTGNKTANADFGVLAAGNHTLTLGGYNNKKNNSNESTQVWIDDVKVTRTPDLQLTPACDDESCCPSGTTKVVLTQNSDTRTFTETNRCIVALGGHDTIQTTGTGTVLLGGDGDDRLVGVANSRVRGGDGRDTINVSGGAVAMGNAGDDIISAANGDNFIYPGAGADVVAGGTGNDTLVVYDVCEISFGENWDGGTGTNTLITPVPLAQLQAMGVTVANFQNIVVQQNSCRSDCSSKPSCNGHGTCAEGGAPGQTQCQCEAGFLPPDCRPSCPPGAPKTEPGACGCNVLDTDRDGDHVPDCLDPCFQDESKVDPGICGCGIQDIDTDHDGIPDCADACPTDPAKTRVGVCGCAGMPAPAGTACNDGPCGVVAACNASGTCGNSDSCSPDPGRCTLKEFDGNFYWFCTGPLTRDQAAAKCRALPGRNLLRIDSRTENQFVANVLTTKSWLSGNDKATEGAWQWATTAADTGDGFWSGAASGTRVGGLYVNWAAGSPGGGAPEDCAAIAAGTTGRGTWSDEACTATLGYVCEQAVALPPITPPVWDCSQFIPGAACTQPPPQSATCVPDSMVFPDRATAEAQVQACKACETLPPADQMTCTTTNCVGAAAPPPPGSVCPNPFAGDEQRFCEIIPRSPRQPCNADSDCTTPGDKCGLFFDPSCSVCNPADPDRKCKTVCDAGVTVCGTFVPGCGDNSGPSPCGEVEVCSAAEDIGTSDPTADPATDLATQTFDADHTFPAPGPGDPTFPADPPCASPPCNEGQNHNWCKYQVADTIDDRNANETKQGQAGTGKKVEFIFDPQLNLSYKGNPLPFGESEFNLDARAGLRAGVKFNLIPPLDGKELDVIDAAAVLTATRCRAHTIDSKLRVMNGEFLPDSLRFDTNAAGPGRILDEAACIEALKTFQNTVDRAKKAFKDAQEIVNQFKVLAAAGKTFSDDICDVLTATAPADFPAGTCVPAQVEETINRFIDYYNQKVDRLHEVQRELGGKVLSFQQPINLGDQNKREDRKIFSANFFVGPVPALLQVNGFLIYGLQGEVKLEAHPGTILNLSENRERIAMVSGKATPHASAGISLFVGAGFEFMGVGASAGVEGSLTLGEITAPLKAGASLEIRPVEDDRPVPVDIAAISDGLKKFPGVLTKKYEFTAGYQYNADIEANHILQGKLSIKIKISFLFFSKTWRKTFLDYPGFNGISKNLIKGEGDATGFGFRAWGLAKMPMPFLNIKKLLPGSGGGGGGGADGGTDGGTDGGSSKEPFDKSKVERLFYDRLCTCQADGQSCQLRDDCCNPSALCRSNNIPGSTAKVCGVCSDELQPCKVTADCCGALTCQMFPDGNLKCGRMID
jgi:hypothetical protein